MLKNVRFSTLILLSILISMAIPIATGITYVNFRGQQIPSNEMRTYHKSVVQSLSIAIIPSLKQNNSQKTIELLNSFLKIPNIYSITLETKSEVSRS